MTVDRVAWDISWEDGWSCSITLGWTSVVSAWSSMIAKTRMDALLLSFLRSLGRYGIKWERVLFWILEYALGRCPGTHGLTVNINSGS